MKRPSFDMILCIALTVLWILYWILEKGSAGKLGERILYALEPSGLLWGLWGLDKLLNRNQEPTAGIQITDNGRIVKKA